MKRSLIAGVLVVLVSGLAWKTVAWLDHPIRRGKLVAEVVREQRDLLRNMPASRIGVLPETLWVENSPALRSWIVAESLRGRAPSDLGSDLRLISNGHNRSTEMDFTLSRWQRALRDWNASLSRSNSYSAGDWLEEGGEKFFESDGYRKVDRGIDGTVDLLWAIQDLTIFIDRYPSDMRVPEALLLLGSAYLQLGSSLPGNIREDRVLNLVFEYFPDSLWATQASAIWSRRRTHES